MSLGAASIGYNPVAWSVNRKGLKRFVMFVPTLRMR